jgi:hypothetical protein
MPRLKIREQQIKVKEQLLEDVEFLFGATESHSDDSEAHLLFAVTYFYANRDILKAINDALFALSEEDRKKYDPYPNDEAWEDRGAIEAVISPKVFYAYFVTPLEPDAINMVRRVLRIAVNAPILPRYLHLLLSPAKDFCDALRSGGGWKLMMPLKHSSD